MSNCCKKIIVGIPGQRGLSGTLFNLPTPKLWLGKGALDLNSNKSISLMNSIMGGTTGNATLHNAPHITSQDVSQEQIDNGVWVEMVFYKRKTRVKRHGDYHVTNVSLNPGAKPFPTDGVYTVSPTSTNGSGLTLQITISSGNITNTTILNGGTGYKNVDSVTVLGTALGGTSPFNDVEYALTIYTYKINKAGYVVPSPWIGGVNPLEVELGMNLKTRGGSLKWPTTDRPNHYKLTKPNETINVWEYLNNRFKTAVIPYNNNVNAATNSYLTCIIPISRSTYHGLNFGKRFAYSPTYTPLYIAFRYITWDNTANDGKGDFISGPLSKVVKITSLYHPFVQNMISDTHTSCSINPKFTENATHLKCTIETKLP